MPSKRLNITLPEGVTLSELKVTLSQEEDCCGRTNGLGQDLTIEVVDGGGGPYAVISTERWAIEPEQLSAFVTLISWMVSTVDDFSKKPSK